MTNVLHGVPPESLRIQRLRGDVVEARHILKTDLESLNAAAMTVQEDEIMLDGCMRRLDTALKDDPDGD